MLLQQAAPATLQGRRADKRAGDHPAGREINVITLPPRDVQRQPHHFPHVLCLHSAFHSTIISQTTAAVRLRGSGAPILNEKINGPANFFYNGAQWHYQEMFDKAQV